MENNYWKLEIPIAHEIFSKESKSDYFIISIGRRNSITNKPLSLKIWYNCEAFFYSRKQIEYFDVVIKDGKLRTIGESSTFGLTAK